MSEWKEKFLTDFSVLSYGDNLPSIELKSFGYKVFGANGFIGFNDKFNIEKQTVTISCRGEYSGTINLVPKNTFVTNNSIPLVLKSDDVNTIFLFYKLQTLNKELIVTGSAQPQVTINDLKRVKIKIPPLPIQRKIARILSTADAVIEKTGAAIAKYKAIKQGMLHDLFTRGIDTQTGKLRPKYEDAPELYKESKLGWIPKEWEVTTIINSTYIKGRIGWQGLRAEEFIETGPYLITGTDFTNGKISWETCYHISENRFNEAPLIQIKNDDVLITKDGTIGKIAFVYKCPDKAILNSGIFVLRCKDESYYHQFLFYLLSSEIFKRWLAIFQGGSTITHLYQREFEKFLFPIPNHDEQNIIIERLEAIDNKIQTEQNYLHKLQQIKAGLMADLLSGKKEVAIAEEPVN